jgi:hypothetical protein
MAEEKEKTSIVISNEIALEEVNKWLDFREVDEEDRADDQKTIKFLAKQVSRGRLVINPDFSLVQKLRFPLAIEGASPVDELKYATRINMDKVHNRLQGIKANDSAARVAAHIAALTSKPLLIIQKMDSEDYKLAATIYLIFFS